MARRKIKPSIVVFTSEDMTAAYCQNAFEAYIAPKVPYRIMYLKRTADSLKYLPRNPKKLVLFLIEESGIIRLKEFLTLLKEELGIEDIRYILLKNGDNELNSELSPFPTAVVNTSRGKRELLFAVADIFEITLRDALEWRRSRKDRTNK